MLSSRFIHDSQDLPSRWIPAGVARLYRGPLVSALTCPTKGGVVLVNRQ